MDENKKNFKFDLMIFKNLDDYLCYVEAVHLMHHEGILRKCDFIDNKSVM